MRKPQPIGHDPRIITFRTLAGSRGQFDHANLGECERWVETTFTFGLETHHPDGSIEHTPHAVKTIDQHRGETAPTLYRTPTRKWFVRIPWHEEPKLKPQHPLFVEVREAWAVQWLYRNGYPVPGGVNPIPAHVKIRGRREPRPIDQHAHRLCMEGGYSQAEISRIIGIEFQRTYSQPQVSRAKKRVENWLNALDPERPKRRKKCTISRDPRKLEPKVSGYGGGRHVIRKSVHDHHDDPDED